MVQKYNIILIWHLYLFTLNVRFIRVNRYIIAIKFYRIGFVYFYFIFLIYLKLMTLPPPSAPKKSCKISTNFFGFPLQNPL